VHLTIWPPKPDGHRESHRRRQASAPNYRKLFDSISSGSGIRSLLIILYAPPMFTSASLPLIKFTATTKAGDDSTASLSAPDS
jgi:hypothetical protein